MPEQPVGQKRVRRHASQKNNVSCDADYTGDRGINDTLPNMWNVKTATITMIVGAVVLYYNLDHINAFLW